MCSFKNRCRYEKNQKILQQIVPYKVNDETLSDIIMEKIILDMAEKEKNKKEDENKQQNTTDNKDFVLIGKNEEQDDEQLNEKLKKT